MISEVINALFVTYLASEYSIAENKVPIQQWWSNNNNSRNNNNSSDKILLPSNNLVTLLVLLIIINVLDRVTGAMELANQFLEGFLHLPKILFSATAYILALYIDIRPRFSASSSVAPISIPTFLAKVGWAFLKVLPLYPILAVLITFVFAFIIKIWEVLDLPEEWPNLPIYYGVLYGPFAYVYVDVKRHFFHKATSLPI